METRDITLNFIINVTLTIFYYYTRIMLIIK